MCRQHDDRAFGDLGLLLDEHGTLRFEIEDDVQVVDDLLANVDRRTVFGECALDGIDGAIDAGAVSTGGSQENLSAHPLMVAAPSARPIRNLSL